MASLSQKWCFLALELLSGYALASSLARNATIHYVSSNQTLSASPQSSNSLRPSYSTSETSASYSTLATTTNGVGDFIAQGFGMLGTSDSPTADASSIATFLDSSRTLPTLASNPQSQASNASTSVTAQQSASSTRALPAPQTDIGTISYTRSANSSAYPTGYYPMDDPTTPPVWLNRSLTLSGDCWNQWSQFWSAKDWPVQRWTSNSESTYTFTSTEGSKWISTSTVWTLITTTVFNGRFPVTTYSTTGTEHEYVWYTGTPTETWTATRTADPGYSVIEGPSVSLQSPSCILPSIVPQCQASWDSWVDWTTRGEALASWGPGSGPPGCNPQATTMISLSCQAPISTWESLMSSWYAKDDPPRCSQAKIAEDYCSSTRSQFLWRGEMKGYYFDDAQTTATTVDGVSTDVMVWPSNGTVGGPGCTLGCGNCALQGETVELIFWPPATLLANDTTTDNSTGPVTVEALGTTFTSPTVRSSSYKMMPCCKSNVLYRSTSLSTRCGHATAAANSAAPSRTQLCPSRTQRTCHRCIYFSKVF
jgi:hypothetical protein